MGNRAWGWCGGLVLGLVAVGRPAAALESLAVRGTTAPSATPAQPLSPSPTLPDAPTFDALLMDLARPPDGTPRGLTASSAALAVRAGAAVLAPQGKPADLGVLRAPALDAPIGALPLGGQLRDVLSPTAPDADVALHDLGHLATRSDGLLMRSERAIFGTGDGRDLLLRSIGAVVGAGVLARMGTTKAQQLGLQPRGKLSLFSGALDQAVSFRCDPGMKMAAIDLASRFHVLHTAPTTGLLRDVFIEGGLTAQHGGDGRALPERYLRVRLSNDHLEGAAGWWDPPDGPPVWSVETLATAGRYRLHTTLSRQSTTGVLAANSALMSAFGMAQLGLFFGGRSEQGLTTGVLALLVF